MDIANQEEGFVIGTGDLSELALGFATFNGDHMSMYGVNASIPKTLCALYGARLRGFVRHGRAGEPRSSTYSTRPSARSCFRRTRGRLRRRPKASSAPTSCTTFSCTTSCAGALRPPRFFELACYAFDGTYARGEILQWLNVFYRRFLRSSSSAPACRTGRKSDRFPCRRAGTGACRDDASGALWPASLKHCGSDNFENDKPCGLVVFMRIYPISLQKQFHGLTGGQQQPAGVLIALFPIKCCADSSDRVDVIASL